MQERRQATRTRVLKAAQLISGQPCTVVNCTVHDLSTGGVCLEAPNLDRLPESFELSFDSFRTARRCRVRWRTQNKIGISFI
jgi:hypothetical protein